MALHSHKTYSGTIAYWHKMLWSAIVDVVTVASIVATMTLPFWIVYIIVLEAR